MRTLLSVVILSFPLGALSKPTRFEVKDAAFRNLVEWVSEAPLEKVVATSNYLSGWMEVDPQNVKAGVKGEFELDVRSFEMGPDSRTARLRETLLAAQDHPGAAFKVERLVESSVNTLAPGKTVFAKVAGVLTARGVARKSVMQLRAVYHPESEWTKKRMTGNLLKVSAYFDLPVADLKFSIPEALNGLIAPTLKVSVDVVGTDQLPVSTP